MAWTEHGIVQNGSIHFAKPLPLPDGTEVEVQIEPAKEMGPAENQAGQTERPEDFAKLPFFGMWADRDDISDSAEWVRQGRQQWHQRTSRTD